ncbi:unnamed protein product [Effrenium voratum]|nr:unnamed protein product [Effrenium voratum]
MKVLAITVLALAAGEVPNLRGTPSEASEKPDDHAVEEPSMVALESVGVAGATCEKWVTCKDGFFGNIRCSGSRYCEFGVLQQCSSRSNPRSLMTTRWKSLPRLTWRVSALQAPLARSG